MNQEELIMKSFNELLINLYKTKIANIVCENQ